MKGPQPLHTPGIVIVAFGSFTIPISASLCPPLAALSFDATLATCAARGIEVCRAQWAKQADGASGIARSACATMRVLRKDAIRFRYHFLAVRTAHKKMMFYPLQGCAADLQRNKKTPDCVRQSGEFELLN